jgi:hypothetical protein
VIAEQVEDAMLGRRRRLDTRSAEEKAVPLRSLLKFECKLKEQIARLRTHFVLSTLVYRILRCTKLPVTPVSFCRKRLVSEAINTLIDRYWFRQLIGQSWLSLKSKIFK